MAEKNEKVLNEQEVLQGKEPEIVEDDFYYPEVEEIDDDASGLPKFIMDDIDLDETLGMMEDVKEHTSFEMPVMDDTSISNTFPTSSTNSDFDTLFDSLYNDVAGANKFISNLIEQKKNVNDNAATLQEDREKLEKEKEEFERFMETQRQSLELEKAQCDEYIRTQKARLRNEESQFNADVEATRAELALTDASIKAGSEKLESEKAQFRVYKELEEKKQQSEKEKIEKDRRKLEADIEQFNKEQDVALAKLKTGEQELQNEKEQFEKSKSIDLEKIKNAQLEIMSQREQFEKFKELEEKKLELESKNLSQSCARFKELVSQFNSGFQQLPSDKN